jgi:hypothetical protein
MQVTHSLHTVHEKNAYRAGHACLSICLCPSIRMSQLSNHGNQGKYIKPRKV